uniref:BTB domain-containing protein n=1 Tax=Panagrellus redivivus TaxID=6233 RepID=A0A7E4W2S4_PANRE
MPLPNFPTIGELVGEHYPYDAKIVVGEDTIEIHHYFACLMSPEFHKMFDKGTNEAQTDFIEIKDFDAATVRDVIDFCYGRQDRQLSTEEVVRMLRFADKYDIKVVVQRFEANLANFITNNTFSMLAHYAWELKGKEHLQQELIDFLQDHPLLTISSKFAKLPMEIKDAIIRAAALSEDAVSGEEEEAVSD